MTLRKPSDYMMICRRRFGCLFQYYMTSRAGSVLIYFVLSEPRSKSLIHGARKESKALRALNACVSHGTPEQTRWPLLRRQLGAVLSLYSNFHLFMMNVIGPHLKVLMGNKAFVLFLKIVLFWVFPAAAKVALGVVLFCAVCSPPSTAFCTRGEDGQEDLSEGACYYHYRIKKDPKYFFREVRRNPDLRGRVDFNVSAPAGTMERMPPRPDEHPPEVLRLLGSRVKRQRRLPSADGPLVSTAALATTRRPDAEGLEAPERPSAGPADDVPTTPHIITAAPRRCDTPNGLDDPLGSGPRSPGETSRRDVDYSEAQTGDPSSGVLEWAKTEPLGVSDLIPNSIELDDLKSGIQVLAQVCAPELAQLNAECFDPNLVVPLVRQFLATLKETAKRRGGASEES